MSVATTSLFLSRIVLNPGSRQVMSEFAHPYEMHRTLMRAFPKAAEDTTSKARDEFGVLFRAEADDRRGRVEVYVQSRIEPDWSCLDSFNGYLCADSVSPAYEHKDIWPACLKLRKGRILSFRLRANPTRRIAKHDDPMRGKRVELGREEDQIDWLIRKGRALKEGLPRGFDLVTRKLDMDREQRPVPCVQVRAEGKQTGRKRDGQNRHGTTHLAVVFEGLLRVSDENTFLETVVRGIGPGKAFGFGLLSFAPCGNRVQQEAR